jgi:hypothetical protein
MQKLRLNLLILYFSLTFNLIAQAFEVTDSSQIMFELNSDFKKASVPNTFQNTINKLDRVWSGKKDDLFEFIAWNQNANIVVIWSPKLKFKKNSPQDIKLQDQLFISGTNGGVLYCKGCPDYSLFSKNFHNEVHPSSVMQIIISELITKAHAADNICFEQNPSSLNEINSFSRQISQEVGKKSILESLKTCNWSLSALIQKSIDDVKKTFGDIVSGNFFSQIANAVVEFEKTIQSIQTKIIPFLSQLRNNLGEVFDHLVCEFTQQNIQNVVMAAVLPGGGAAGAAAKISINVVRLEENLRALVRHDGVLKALRSIKERNQGRLPENYLRALSEIRTTLPLKPQSFGSNISRESHFRSHSELRFRTAAEYENAALAFASRNNSSSIVMQTQKNKRWVKYDLETKEFVVMNRKGELITYFRKSSSSDEHAFERFIKDFDN